MADNKPLKTMSYPIEDYTPPYSQSKHDLKTSYQWDGLLSRSDILAAPVKAFRHAPMNDCWQNIIVGMKVEVENRDTDHHSGVFSNSYWVASVLRISGYYAHLRYEGFGQDGTKDFWMNLCSDKVHPVGWCATKGKPLIPPKSIQSKYSDWKDFLVKRLTGARTLPSNFYMKVMESVSSIFRPNMKLELVDKMRICQVRVTTIKEITGRRLYLQYDETEHEDNVFWCHEESPLIHPIGWARRVGHQVAASQDYFDRCAMDNLNTNDCTPDMFPEYRQAHMGNLVPGMKLEAVDPLNLATICVATVMKVLRHGYIMIRIDGYENDATGSDWFCYHASSPLIFPPGFCERNKIELKPPTGWEDKFSWYEYLKDTNAKAAPIEIFCPREPVEHDYEVGMKVEAADQMDPKLICVGTIARVVGRLLKVHFDGWEDDYDQWMDCESVDIYPVGWAELVGHKLEGPRLAMPAKKEKKLPKKGGRGKKRSHNPSNNSSNGGLSPGSALSQNGDSNNRIKKKATSESPIPPATTPDEGSIRADSTTPPPPVLEPEMNRAGPEMEPEVRLIPRLVDTDGQTAVPRVGTRDENLNPGSWTCDEVAQFLEINEIKCDPLVEAIIEQKVDGKKFLSLQQKDLMALANNKFGPVLKVENLLGLLKARMDPAQARFLSTIRKS